tara:strand:+ start:550 stop:810 length:261 start_codon:yes stop_codon:yes gene_type:complete
LRYFRTKPGKAPGAVEEDLHKEVMAHGCSTWSGSRGRSESTPGTPRPPHNGQAPPAAQQQSQNSPQALQLDQENGKGNLVDTLAYM